MSTPATQPYDWLRSIPPSLFEVDEVPLMGHTPPFPWKNFADLIAKKFDLSQFTLTPSDFNWTEPADLLTGLSNDPYVLQFNLSNYQGTAAIALNKKDLEDSIYSFLLHSSSESGLLDEQQKKTFLQFFIIAFCDQFIQTNWEKGLQLHFDKEAPLPQEAQLAMDIQVDTPNKSFTLRLFVNDTLRKNWKDKHVAPFEVAHNPPLAKKLQLPVSIEAGYINMSMQEWQKVHPGDFLMLDTCTIDQAMQQGTLLLRVYHLPYYKGSLSDGNIILQEQPSYNEIESTMPIKKDDDSDFDFDEDSEHEHTEHTEHDEESEFNFDDDSDFDFDEESEIAEDSDFEDDDTHQGAAATAAPPAPKQATPTPTAAPKAPAPAAGAPAAQKPAAEGKPTTVEKSHAQRVTTPKDIPLHIVVEVGRFEMSVEKMMELQPGNMLSLHVRPEDGVDLVVNGRRIGKGELLKFGETLGVRITEIG